MDACINWNELSQFSGSEEIFRHWSNRKLCYTSGISYLAKKINCYWLIEEIAFVLLPKLIKKHKDSFYLIQIAVNSISSSAVITVEDGNGKIYLEHKLSWTDFPAKENPVKFYLCDSGSYYCLMLPSEY